MNNTIHILAVEDDGIIYKDIKDALKTENFSVDGYTPSVVDAIARISKRRPDLVLLDIDLQGEHTGIDLGTLLMTEYKIPFIYVTDHGDNKTYFEALKTQHQDFIEKEYQKEMKAPIVVETKPELQPKKIIRAIYNMLSRKPEQTKPYITKKFVMGYVDYIKNTKSLGEDELQQRTVEFKNIAYFTRFSTELNPSYDKSGTKNNKYLRLKDNYTRYIDWEDNSLYIHDNMDQVIPHLPYNFVQINDAMVVNIHPDELKGTINTSWLKLRDGEKYKISRRYKKDVKERINHFYLRLGK